MSAFTVGGLSSSDVLVVVFTLLTVIRPTTHIRIWKTLYMDDEASCETFIRNDDLEEGDMYLIKSDSWQGQSTWARRPAECTLNVNLGDRLVALSLVEWWCDKMFKDPFLAIYDNCLGDKTNLLVMYNCSNVKPRTVYSSSTCISIYHFRGHTRSGYFFSMELIGGQEVIAFPAGGIAALIVMCIVVIMVIIKIICVITGYENKLPVIRFDPEDPKHSLLPGDSTGSPDGGTQETSTSTAAMGTASVTVDVSSSGGRLPTAPPAPCGGRPPPHNMHAKSHSSAAPGEPHQEHNECWDSDGMEGYSPPRLKRYVSVRASRILKL